MQGLESLNEFKSFVSKIGGLGRYEDTYMVHAAEGETVVPMEVLDRNPVLKKRLFKTMMEMGIEPGRYIVGNELNSKNPVTGQPEFFLKYLGRRLRKAAADISGYAAPIVGAMYGPAAGAAAGAALGQYKRENPGDPNQGMQMALRGGLSGLAANVASGQGLTPFGGARGAYGMEGKGSLNPLNIGKRMLGMESKGGGTGKGMDFFKDFKNPFAKDKTSIFEKAKKYKADALASGLDVTDAQALEAASKGGIGPAGMNWKDMMLYGGLGTGILGKLIESGKPKGDDTEIQKNRTINDMIFQNEDWRDRFNLAEGGIADLRDGGESKGPGTGTSDSIPAMLSDGEFVMTADAVRGAGGGDRREGAKKMYEAMDRLEARA
jgi:hypothetical protein